MPLPGEFAKRRESFLVNKYPPSRNILENETQTTKIFSPYLLNNKFKYHRQYIHGSRESKRNIITFSCQALTKIN